MAITSTDPIQDPITGPGGPMPVRVEQVRGHAMPVFADRCGSLRELLASSARHGDAEYLVCDELRLTYTEHLRRVARLAHVLETDYGIGHGDRVAVSSANNAEWIMAFWAATSLGAVIVGMNAFWSPLEIAHGLDRTTPKLIIADHRRAEAIAPEADRRQVPLVTVDRIADLAATVRKDEPAAGYPLPTTAIDEDDPAVIIFTSGTSGKPKGATHSHRNVIAAVDFYRYNDTVAAAAGRPRTLRRYLMTSPLFHIAALHNLAAPRLQAGDTVVIYTGRFDVDTVLRLIERERIESWGAVPTMANRLVRHGDLSGYDLSSLKVLSLGAAPSSAELKQQLRVAVPAVARTLGTNYGQTECSTAATFATAADLEADPDTVGRPIVNVEVAVIGEHGDWLPDGQVGEICVRGATVMLGYWGDEEATAAAIDADGWLHTGDIGVLSEGYLTIASRRSDLILRGGENIYPMEVEAAFDDHPAVREAAVFGVPHEDLGEEVAAVVVLESAESMAVHDVESLCAHLAERIGRYKIPTRWRTTTEPLPRNATGKVVRHGLSDLL